MAPKRSLGYTTLMLETPPGDPTTTWDLPRSLTPLESLLLEAGARLDRFVLNRYLRRQAFPAPADPSGLRERLARALEFYRDPRFIDAAHADKQTWPVTIRMQKVHDEVAFRSDFTSPSRRFKRRINSPSSGSHQAPWRMM